MTSFKPLVASLLFLIQCLQRIHGAPCGALQNPEDCAKDLRCQYSDLRSECYCASQVPLDVIFFLDSSGSMGSDHFIKEKNFVKDMIEQGLSEESHAHVITFASGYSHIYKFWQTQWPRDNMYADILGASYTKGGTYMKKALGQVKRVFDLWSGKKKNKGYEGFDRLVVFLTDGKPSGSQSPCTVVPEVQSYVGEENIIVIGMGDGWTEASIQCMVTPGYPNGVPDTGRILKVEKFEAAAFTGALIAADDFLCPGALSVKLTEVRMEEYVNGADTHHSRWIEILNNGLPLDLSVDSFTFEGIVSAPAFGKEGNVECTLTIARGQYLVIYDPAAPHVPQCKNCKNCTLNAETKQCDEAIYFPCDSTTNTSCGPCTWDTSATASNEVWTQTIKDYVAQSVLTNATRESADATGWTKVYTGYSTELKSASLWPQDAVNWDMSCTGRGTPGHDPLRPCNAECIVAVCQAKGDVNATCDATDVCDCTLSNGYYIPDSTPSCTLLYAPQSCTVENEYDPELGTISIIRWTKGSTENEDIFFEVDDGTEVVTKLGLEALKQYAIPGGTTVTVRSVYNDRLQGNVYSAYATCTVDTAAPTNAPTPTPTQSNANIDTCTATVEGYDTVTVSWSAAYAGETGDILPPYEYYLFGNWYAAGDQSTEIEGVPTTALSETLIVPDALSPLDIATNGEPSIWVVTAILNPETGQTDYVRMKANGEGKQQCAIVTGSPTPQPSESPTKDPSESPTTDPTKAPTLSPTFGAWTMDSCLVTIPAKDSRDDGTVYIRFTYSTEPEAANTALLEFVLNGQQKASARSTAGGTSFTKAVGITQSDLDTAMANDGFQARVLFDSQPGTQERSENRACLYRTEGPTVSPTEDPTEEPTDAPTKEPSVSPTKHPTTEPTQAPTYEPLTLDPCTAELNVEKTHITVRFTETTFRDNDPKKRYPRSADIFYELRVGPSESGAYYPADTPYVEAADSSGEEKIVQFTLPETFVFSVETSAVTVDIAGAFGDRSSLPVTCSLITQEPTVSPTTPEPTRFPTSVSPLVRLDLLDFEQNVKDGDWGFDGACVNLGLEEDEQRRRRRLQDDDDDDDDEDTSSVEDVLLVNNCPFCPVCSVKEDVNVKYLRIIREPVDFPYDVVVKLAVNYLGDSAGTGMSVDDVDLDQTDNLWHSLFESQLATKYIVGGTDNTIVIPYYLKVDDNPDSEPEPTEAFEFRVSNCAIDESGGATNPVPEGLEGIYSCTVGAYYAAAIISIEQPAIDTFTTALEGEMPMWVWIPIGLAALAIPLVSYLIYRFYKGRKAAEKMEVQRTFELGEAEKQDDMAEFGVRGDQVTSNPLATGAAFEVDKGDVAIDRQLQFEKMNFEVATTEVEHNIFKQDFGPVQAEKHDMDGPAQPETTAETQD